MCKTLPFLVFGACAVALVAAPYRVAFEGFPLAEQTAFADNHSGGSDKSGNKGGGDKGADNSSGGGNKGGGSKGGGGKDPNGSAPRRESVNSRTGARIETSGSSILITHRDGIQEEISNSRYTMRDAQGRRIIVRRATVADLARLRGMER